MAEGIPTETALLKADIILNSFNKMGCDAITLGSKDFSTGLDRLLDLEARANFPFLSANIRNDLGQSIFKPYTIVSKGDVTLGVIGLTSVFTNDEIQVEDPIPILESLVDEVRSQSDFVVLLFHANEQDIATVRNSDLDIDLIIQSKSTRRSNDGGAYKIPVYTCGDRGKYVYRFQVQIADNGTDVADLSRYQKEIVTLEKQLRRITKGGSVGSLDPNIPEEKRRINQVKDIQRKIDLIRKNMEMANSFISFEKIEMGKHIMDKPEILLIVDEGKKRISELSSPQPAIPYNTPSGKRK